MEHLFNSVHERELFVEKHGLVGLSVAARLNIV